MICIKTDDFSGDRHYTSEIVDERTQMEMYCELQHKYQLCFEFSIETAEIMENCP